MSVTVYPKPEILSQIPLDEHAVIEASAGTGKTYTIEHLFVEILLTKDVFVENILVVTYTEKAAAELRARVRKIIQNILECGKEQSPEAACWLITKELRLKLERALFSFDKAPIHTIHGFFQRVIVENAFTGGRLFDQALVETGKLFSEEFKNVLRTHIAKDKKLQEFLVPWLENGSEAIAGLEKLLLKVHQKKCSIQPVFDPEASASEFQQAAALFQKEMVPDQVKVACKNKKVNGNTVNALIKKITNVRTCLDEQGQAGQGITPPAGITNVELGYILDKLTPVLGEGSEAIQSVKKLQALMITPAAIAANLFLPLVRTFLNDRKLREGLYDFDDMIGYLKEALTGPQADALVRSLRTRYRYALIDESQDTDEAQWDIFKKIFYESSAGNRIYLIGDPKQAIYGFRGADVYTYLEARKDICKKAAPIRLEENFRSTGSLIRAYNLLLDQNARQPFFSGEIKYEYPVKSGLKEMQALDSSGRPLIPVKIIQAVPDKNGKLLSWYFKQQVGRFIAKEIKGLLGDGKIRILQKDKEPKEVTARGIFILTRTGKDGYEVASYLRQEQIPFAFYKQEGLFQTREAEEVRDLLAAIADPADGSKKLKAWMSGFFGLSIEALPHCKGLPDTEPLNRQLLAWHALGRRRDYRHLFTRIVDESGIVRRELFLQDNERQLTNYYHIFEILLEETMHASCDMEDIVQLLNSFIADTRRPAGENGNVQRLETEKEAVQIMTLHKSKGLEAPVVFIYGGFTSKSDTDLFTFHENNKRIVHVGGKPSPEKLADAEREVKEENQRLLYVGITRAKVRLYLPFIANPEEGERTDSLKSGPYNELNRRINEIRPEKDQYADLFEWCVAGAIDGAANEEPGVAAGTAPDWQPDPAVLAVAGHADELARIRQKHAGFVITSYSRIKQKEKALLDEGAEDRDLEQSDHSASAWQGEEAAAGPAFGSAMHRMMERMPFDSFQPGITCEEWSAQKQIQDICRESLEEYGVGLTHLPLARDLAFDTLTAPVELGQNCVVPGLWTVREQSRETEFLYPYPEEFNARLDKPGDEFLIDRGYVKGYIDLMFRYENRIYFLDWKTDRLAEYSPKELQRHFSSRYLLQVKLYMLAMVKLMGCHSQSSYDADFGGILYCFMRGMKQGAGMHLIRPAWEEVLAYEQELTNSRTYV